MSRPASALLCCLLISVVSACSEKLDGESVRTAAAPTMPAEWSVTKDETFSPADIRPLSEKLGGEVTALRNTTYDVKGLPVKVNTIVTASSSDADKIMLKLRTIKPQEFLLRDGRTIYEFVGTNDSLPAMRAGMKHLEATRGS